MCRQQLSALRLHVCVRVRVSDPNTSVRHDVDIVSLICPSRLNSLSLTLSSYTPRLMNGVVPFFHPID